MFKSLFWMQMKVELNFLRIVLELVLLLISICYLYWSFFVVGPCVASKGLHLLVLTLWGGNIVAFLVMMKSALELLIVAIHTIKIYFRCHPK